MNTYFIECIIKEKVYGVIVMEEIWKDIEGYEERYQVSNFGRVKNIRSDKILKNQKSGAGYAVVCLYKEIDGDLKSKTFVVHRLVGEYFLSNPNKYPIINHIDENKMNPHINNLEWCSAKMNSNHGNRNRHISKSSGVPVCQYKLTGELVAIWKNSMRPSEIIHRKLGGDVGNISRGITSVTNGRSHMAYGHIWRKYDKESFQEKIPNIRKSFKSKKRYLDSIKRTQSVIFTSQDIKKEDLYEPYQDKSLISLLEEIEEVVKFKQREREKLEYIKQCIIEMEQKKTR